MRYVRNTIWNKQLPSYVGVVVLLLALGITITLSRNTVFFVTKATVGSVPKEVQISNVTDTSFTVSYITDEAVVGTLAYGTDPQTGGIALDTRDIQLGEPAEYRVHYLTVDNLLPSTKYYFAITSATQIIDDEGKPYEVTTAPQVRLPLGQAELVGTVALSNGNYPTGGVVSVATDASQTLTALIQPDGSYRLPIAQLRSNTLAVFVPLADTTILQMKVNSGTETATATLPATQSQVPHIVLGQTYDFTISADPLGSKVASESGSIASESADFPIFEEPVTVNAPEITSPEEAQAFSDQQPLFKGMALPSTEVVLTIQSEKEITATLQSDNVGRWEFRPPVPIDPGEHTITMESTDASGLLQTITRSFTVYAQGSQFIEPSISPIVPTADPNPQPTPTLVATPTATPSATPTPTIAVSPTATSSGEVTPTRGPLDPTGSTTAVMGIVTSMLFLASGVILFFLISV